MQEHHAVLGGEQSGHVIFTEHAQTGDGLLTAVQLLNVVAGTGKELRQLRAEAITEYPQVLVNVPVGRLSTIDDATDLWRAVRDVESTLGESGRVLVRPSGPEPLVRIMVEAASESETKRYADVLADAARSSFREQVG